ncbi:hypothetical protein TYRP_015850 [Tyrophagus putrescentiae]|nr:hypothetical protein TYRP_015850 [Tyrophagus putrescentiae]
MYWWAELGELASAKMLNVSCGRYGYRFEARCNEELVRSFSSHQKFSSCLVLTEVGETTTSKVARGTAKTPGVSPVQSYCYLRDFWHRYSGKLIHHWSGSFGRLLAVPSAENGEQHKENNNGWQTGEDDHDELVVLLGLLNRPDKVFSGH